jgi:hypothetical protein
VTPLDDFEQRLRDWLSTDEASEALDYCSCGSVEVEGACVDCGELRCGSCSVLTRFGLLCEDCRFGANV